MPDGFNNPQTAVKYLLNDADTHWTEPHNFWTARAPKSLIDRVPQVREIDGQKSWVIDGDKIIGRGASPSSAMYKDGGKARCVEDLFRLKIEDVHPGSYSLKERLAHMDLDGIWAQIVYPNILGFGGQHAAKVDPELRLASTQIFNDAMADLQKESGGRFCPMALLPWWDVTEAVKETRRCIDLGFKGININSAPHNHTGIEGQQLPWLGATYWDPLWDLCNQTRIPINFHIGSSEQSTDWMGAQWWPGLPDGLKFGLGGAMLFFGNATTLANLIYAGIIDRFENLQFVSVESGIGWVPFLLEALDYQYGEMAAASGLKRLPSEYFPTNFYGTFWFEKRHIVESIRNVGVDRCMFQTDFPHPTSLHPVGDVDTVLNGLNAAEKHLVMFENCARLYNIEAPPAAS